MPRPLVAIVAAAVAALITATSLAATHGPFRVSYTAGTRDLHGMFMGGTELRNLTAYEGRLYAGNGYWMDEPGTDGAHGAQILVLDRLGGRWRVTHSFDARLAGGAPAQFAVSALRGIRFSTDARGHRLRAPVSMLLAAVWDLRGISQVFARSDSTGAWTTTNLAAPRTSIRALQQVRAFGSHRDRATHVDMVFAGQSPHGIYSGVYDRRTPGGTRWNTRPELDLSGVSRSFPGLGRRLRVTSFAECNGVIYAAVGQEIYRRIDGRRPRWRLVWVNPQPGYSQSGLRGLTAVRGRSGPRQVLLAAVEGSAGRVVRIDPARGYRATTELDVNAFLSRRWGAPVRYTISAYSDMTAAPGPHGGQDVLIGVEGRYASGRAPSGHTAFHGWEGGAWYLVREPSGRYGLHEIAGDQPVTHKPLVSTRAIARSPFPGRTGNVFFGGFDANSLPVHNTAWVFRAPLTAALG